MKGGKLIVDLVQNGEDCFYKIDDVIKMLTEIDEPGAQHVQISLRSEKHNIYEMRLLFINPEDDSEYYLIIWYYYLNEDTVSVFDIAVSENKIVRKPKRPKHNIGIRNDKYNGYIILTEV